MKTNFLVATLCSTLAFLDLSTYVSGLSEIEVGTLRGVGSALEIESYSPELSHDYRKKKLIELSRDSIHYAKTGDRTYLTSRDINKNNLILPRIIGSREYRDSAELSYEIEPIWDTFDIDRKNKEMKIMGSKLCAFATDHAANPKDLWQGLVFAGFGIYGFWCAFRDKYLIKQEPFTQ